MSSLPLEERVALLETEVMDLKRHLSTLPGSTPPWWEQIMGAFADTPAFDEAVQLGRQYREAQTESASEVPGDDVSS